MFARVTTALAAAALLLAAPTVSRAALATYTQNFESLTISDPAALSNDGWLVYGNVFTPAKVYMYGYGPFPAPNPGGGFCAIAVGQGGPLQGAQQLSIYADYNNTDQAVGNLVESNTYREQTVAAADVGKIWTFQFDAKLGNLVPPTTAVAFIKTLNPSAGYALTNFITVDMTAIPITWNTYSLQLTITPDLVGQLAQIGFANTCTNYVGSGVFYDNLVWQQTGTVSVEAPRPGNVLALRAPAPNPFVGATRFDFSLARQENADVSLFDVSGRRVATLYHGMADAGPHQVTWDGRFGDGGLAPAGVYQVVLQTAEGRLTKKVVRSR